MNSKVKNTVAWTYIISDLNGEEIVETFNEKELQNTNQKEFIIEKVTEKKNETRCMSNGKDMIIHLIVELIKVI